MNSPSKVEWDELFKRAVALAFTAAYTYTHKSERAAAIRVAYLAKRFMDGENADVINRDADHESALREERQRAHKEQQQENRVHVLFRRIRRKK